jgi:hypothetical protein
MEPGKALMACIVRHYTSGLYRTCVSLDRENTICLGTHQDEASATETMNQFLETYKDGKIRTLEDVLLYVNSICNKEQVSEMAA